MSLPKFRVALRGEALLAHPRFNKGTAFTASERKAFGLTGKLPYRINSLDEQCQRAYDQLQSQTTDIGKNSFLQSMKDQNWVLFYSLLTRHLRELIPIIYTPTEGWPHERIRGKEYDDFVDKYAFPKSILLYQLSTSLLSRFVQLVRKYFPHSLLHFEDYGVTNAQRLLQRYRDTHAVFNDDIQGTGAVTLSTLMAAIGVTKSKLCDQRIIIYGAGSAGLGIAKQLRDAMVSINNIPVEEANAHFWLIDKHGLIRESLPDVRDDLKEYVRKDAEWEEFQSNGDIKLLDVVKKVKPTVMIGTSTHAGGFTKEVVEAMAAGCDRPIIFPLSNPSRLVEVDPRDANDWTKGKALLATGSPFPPAKMPNGKDYIIAECNNALIYPGLGFGSMISQSRIMTDTMIIAGARRLASLSPALKDPDDALLPDFGDAPSVNFEVAVAVAEQAIEEGSAGVDWKKEEVREKAKERLWQPIYGEYVYDENGDK
ncbi:hypothetical protein HHX47_DHR1001898 [Lentinula edodes]|nr:hypothetical protein HHX47_DHR1001898 [Lentinula edodes]